MPEMPIEPVFVSDRSYFIEALKTDQLVVGEFNEGRVTKQRSLPLALAAPASGDRPKDVVVAGLDLTWLGQRLKVRDLAPRSAVTIADRNGRILAREPLPKDFVGTIIPDAFQYLVRAEAPGSLELTSQDGTRRVIGYFPVDTIPRGLYVSAGLATETAYAALDRATLRALGIALASIIAAFFLARSTSEAFIRRPVSRIVATIGRWRRDDLAARTGMTARDGELGAIGKAVDGFMDELVSARSLRRKSERQRSLLSGELDHRVKNLLATVQAVARQSFRNSERTEVVNVFINRLATMSNAHGLLMKNEWQEATVRAVVETTIAPFMDPQAQQFTLGGPELTLNSRAVLALGMALHELCTNAAKYGALQGEAGRIAINWDVLPGESGGNDVFQLVWEERGGPPVAAPSEKGFGSRMIEDALAQQIDGEATILYRAEGVVCTVTAPLAVVGSQRDMAA